MNEKFKLSKSVVHEDPDKRTIKEILAEVEKRNPELKKSASDTIVTKEMLRGARGRDYKHRKNLGKDY